MTTAPNTTSPPLTTTPSKPTPWHEIIPGTGIRRDHKTTCTASQTRNPGHRCQCPYSFWNPTINGKRKRVTVYASLTEARAAKQKAHDQAKTHRRTHTNQLAGITPMPTLNEFFEQLMQREWGQKRVSTQDRRHTDYNARLREPLGKYRLDQLTPQLIESRLYDHIEREGNRRCVQGAHDTLTALLQVAVKKQLLTNNPAKAVTYPEQQMIRKPVRVLDADQYRTLIEACRDRREQLIIRLLCEAGLRRSELLALQVGDIDFKQGTILVQRRHYKSMAGHLDIDLPKSRRARTVAINDTLTVGLGYHLADQGFPPRDQPVFTRCNHYTNHQPEPPSGSSLYKLVKRIAKTADIGYDEETAWMSPHILRATGASIAVAAGVPEHIAQKQLGHSRPETTSGYLRLPVVEPLREHAGVFE